MWWLLSLAMAQDTVVPEGKTVEVVGPAVWMPEDRYRLYVSRERQLPACLDAVAEATDRVIAAEEKTLAARDVAKRDLGASSAAVITTLEDKLATTAATLDRTERKLNRRTKQRDVALGIAGGFIAASAAATAAAVLSR